jgi:hypothetical protein
MGYQPSNDVVKTRRMTQMKARFKRITMKAILKRLKLPTL